MAHVADSETDAADPAEAADGDDGADATSETVDERRRTRLRRRRVRMAVGLVAIIGLYLMGTFLNPRVVPRFSFLPRPPSRGTWFDTCNGAPGNRHTESWERYGVFWSRTEFHTLAGCIDPPPP